MGVPGGGRDLTNNEIIANGFLGGYICRFASVFVRADGTLELQASYFQSEPSVDFQFSTWNESLEEKLLERGHARIDPSIVAPASWQLAQKRAKARGFGMWSHAASDLP
jgi:hypothetical protein